MTPLKNDTRNMIFVKQRTNIHTHKKRKKDKFSKRANINGQLKQKISSHTFPTIKSRKSTFHQQKSANIFCANIGFKFSVFPRFGRSWLSLYEQDPLKTIQLFPLYRLKWRICAAHDSYRKLWFLHNKSNKMQLDFQRRLQNFGISIGSSLLSF